MKTIYLTIVLVFAIGCGSKPQPKADTPASAPSVSIAKVEKKPIKRTIEQPGAVMAFEETILHSKIPGFVGSIAKDPNKSKNPEHDQFVDIGSKVGRGQLLAVLKVPELHDEQKQKLALITQAEAEEVQSQKALIAANAGVTAAKAQVNEAKAVLVRAEALYERWASERERVAKLVSGGVIDAQTKDETENQFKAALSYRSEVQAKVASAEAAVKKAEADQGKATADVAAFKARLDVAKAELQRLTSLLEYTKITSPYDGVVTKRSVNTGDLVASGGKQGLFVVARIDPVRVVLQVPEADAALVSVGQDVKLTLAGAAKSGKVTRTSWSLEPGSRTLRTEIDLPNSDGLLRPGMYTYAKMEIELAEGLAVPSAAVGKYNDEPVIYLVENGKAVRVVVQLHRGDPQFTQIKAYKKPDSKDWTPLSGSETIAMPFANVTNGQDVK